MPPRCTEPASLGLCGSLTSYCFSSPVPQHETYSQRSSTDRSMSLTSGGTAPKGCSAGGSCEVSAGSAGVGGTLFPPPPGFSPGHHHTAADQTREPLPPPPETPGLFRFWG